MFGASSHYEHNGNVTCNVHVHDEVPLNTLQFYGTVITEADTLHIEPLVQLGPVQTTNKVAGVVTMLRPIVSLSYLDSQCLRLQSFLQTRIS